jgi:hypothetical protein
MSMIEAEVMASGATAATSAHYALDATVGQAVVGQISNLTHVCQGFWCGPVAQQITLLYRITFGQIDIALCLLVLCALVATRTAYDTMRQLWTRRLSNSQAAIR